MENAQVTIYSKMLQSLPLDVRLELLSALTESIYEELASKPQGKAQLLSSIHGAWSDMPNDPTEEIYHTRTVAPPRDYFN